MSFAIWYACYMLLENTYKNESPILIPHQTYVHNSKFRGRKSSVNSLRKKFKNSRRGGSSL